MKPITDKNIRLHLVGLVPKLSISKSTMRNYVMNGQFSTDACIEIERVTNGEISRQQLRPDVFTPLPCDYELADRCIDCFVDYMNAGKFDLLISVLNYLEFSQPIAHEYALDKISKLDNGEAFVAQRLAHRGTNGRG